MRSITSMAAYRRGLIFAASLMLVALVHGSAEAARSRIATVFLDGYVGTAPAGVTAQANLVLQYSGKRQPFAVTGTGVTRGKGSSQRLLNDLRPKHNILILVGSEATLGAIGSNPPGQRVRITGDHRRGSNQLNVTSIAAAPAAPEPAPTAGKK